jgi:hypothetical protein
MRSILAMTLAVSAAVMPGGVAHADDIDNRTNLISPNPSPAEPAILPGPAAFGACARIELPHRPRWVDPALYRPGHPANVGNDHLHRLAKVWPWT